MKTFVHMTFHDIVLLLPVSEIYTTTFFINPRSGSLSHVHMWKSHGMWFNFSWTPDHFQKLSHSGLLLQIDPGTENKQQVWKHPKRHPEGQQNIRAGFEAQLYLLQLPAACHNLLPLLRYTDFTLWRKWLRLITQPCIPITASLHSAVTPATVALRLAAALRVHVSWVMGMVAGWKQRRRREGKERKTPQGHMTNHSAGFCSELRTGHGKEQRIERRDVQHTSGTEHTWAASKLHSCVRGVYGSRQDVPSYSLRCTKL